MIHPHHGLPRHSLCGILEVPPSLSDFGLPLGVNSVFPKIRYARSAM